MVEPGSPLLAFSDHAAELVERTAGSEADDDPHRPRRIGLRPRDPRHGRNRGSTCGQMQKTSTFHGDPKDFGQGQISAQLGWSEGPSGFLPESVG